MTAANFAVPSVAQKLDYDFNVVRLFVIASAFWGIAAFAVGVYVALQLAYPVLDLDLPWTSFGRLRPLHKKSSYFRVRRQYSDRHFAQLRATHVPGLFIRRA